MNLAALYESDAAEMLFEDTDDEDILQNIIPLPTEDDLPYDDGEPMETERHRDQMILLIESLKAFWGDKKQYFAGGNMFVHFDLSGKKKFKGPDFFLVMDAENRERKSWVVWQENLQFPDLIIEILSDSTRVTDKTEKKTLYEKVFRTAEYYLYDPFSFECRGYRLMGKRYEPVLPDKDKKMYSPVTELYLIVRDGRLRWMSQDGYILPNNAELFERELKISQTERQRADDAERLLAEYRRIFGEL